MPSPGQVVGGRYSLVRPLGEGGMASVWAAEHLTVGNIVALKIISPDLLKHSVAIARFQREARAAAKLKSPYVVQIYDHDVDPELGPFIAMELLEGESLADRLEYEPTLAPPVVSRILLQVAKALAKAHALGIVHRDLKPDNIFLVVDEEGAEIAKILDFGVAKADSPLQLKEGNRKTVAGTLLGTLNYMSPEQAQGREVDHLSDLWALGVIAFECLVGRRPFDDDAPGALVLEICAYPLPVPSKHNPDVPLDFDEWFAKACNRDPSQRFQSARELSESLAEVCDTVLGLEDITAQSIPVHKPPSILAPRPVAATEPQSEPAPTPAPKKKRNVLQIVASEPPPPLEPPSGRLQIVPSDAPGPPSVPAPEPSRPDAPVTGVRTAPGKKLDRDAVEPAYHVMHAGVTVGPVTAGRLRRGLQTGRVPWTAKIWREGWDQWKTPTEAKGEILAWPAVSSADLHNKPGIEAVGLRSLPPPNAPAAAPAASPNKRGGSK